MDYNKTIKREDYSQEREIEMKPQKSQKQVIVIARYAHKHAGQLTGLVSYLVRSSDGHNKYCCTLKDGKAIGCSCPSRKPCYHMIQLEAKEQERRASAAQAAFKAADAIIAEPAVAEREEALMASEPVEQGERVVTPEMVASEQKKMAAWLDAWDVQLKKLDAEHVAKHPYLARAQQAQALKQSAKEPVNAFLTANLSSNHGFSMMKRA